MKTWFDWQIISKDSATEQFSQIQKKTYTVYLPGPGPKSKQIHMKPCPIAFLMRPSSPHPPLTPAHVERDGSWFYVDVGGFWVRTGQEEVNFRNGFAYFVGLARANMSPYGSMWAQNLGPIGP